MKSYQKRIILYIFLFFIAGCGLKNHAKPNALILYNHIVVYAEEDIHMQISAADYVFLGEVTKLKANHSSDDDFYTLCQVLVLKNLKGNLIEEVEIKYLGAHAKDGTLLLYRGEILIDDGLPEPEQQYLFTAFTQPDGILLIAPLT